MAEVAGIKTYTTRDAIIAVGISKDTLYRYEKELGPFIRDEKGNRVLTEQDIVRLKAFKKEKIAKKLKRR